MLVGIGSVAGWVFFTSIYVQLFIIPWEEMRIPIEFLKRADVVWDQKDIVGLVETINKAENVALTCLLIKLLLLEDTVQRNL